jgi:hypothetical protein
VDPVPESMADNDKRATRALGCSSVAQRNLLGQRRTVILHHGLERAQKISAGRRDFPAFIVAKHITAAKNIDGWGPLREAR